MGCRLRVIVVALIAVGFGGNARDPGPISSSDLEVQEISFMGAIGSVVLSQ